ncbi:hypothetical protein BK412_21365 [Vibrio campbellii]|uniref:hypothetical protein n=1 Tax=Vibrio campbellii TaxID=680 RepID=UPI0009C00B0A|nr:hypothetical protein [Vibrio campbellii]OQQ00755.1 hypothetical protein BK412_21365 [Vibrio campbellii]
MKKLFNLKKWLTLEDCAKRLSYIFEEHVSIKDIVQLCLDGELDICWLFRHGWAQEAAESHSLLGAWFIDPQNIPVRPNNDNSIDSLMHDHLYGKPTAMYRIVTFSEPYRIEGAYKLNIDTGVLKDHLMSFITDKPTELVSFEGCLLTDSFGRYICPVEFLPTEKGEAVFARLNERAYPTDKLPELEELVILRSDIEKLESKLSGHSTNILRTPEETLKQSLGILATLLSQSNAKYRKGNTANCSQIAKEVELFAARMGMDLESSSNLNRDISASLKYLDNWQPK